MQFIELKTYTLRPGSVPLFLEAFGRIGEPALARLGVGPQTQAFSVIGQVNQVVQFWHHDGVVPMQACLDTLAGDAGWSEFERAVLPFVLTEQSSILVDPSPPAAS